MHCVNECDAQCDESDDYSPVLAVVVVYVKQNLIDKSILKTWAYMESGRTQKATTVFVSSKKPDCIVVTVPSTNIFEMLCPDVPHREAKAVKVRMLSKTSFENGHCLMNSPKEERKKKKEERKKRKKKKKKKEERKKGRKERKERRTDTKN